MDDYQTTFNERGLVENRRFEKEFLTEEYRLCEWRFQDPELENWYVEFKEMIDNSDKGLSYRALGTKEVNKISHNKANKALAKEAKLAADAAAQAQALM